MNILGLTYCFHSTSIILAEVRNILFRDRTVPGEAADMTSKLILCDDIERQRNVDDERNLLGSSDNGGLSRAGTRNSLNRSSGLASDVDDIVPELQDRRSNSKNMNNNNNNYHKNKNNSEVEILHNNYHKYAFDDTEKEKEKRKLKIRRIKTNGVFVLFFCFVCFIFCFVLLLVLLQMKIYFQSKIDKIRRKRLPKPTYDESMSYSSDIIILEKQSLTSRLGLSICLDMFAIVCLCQYLRIVSNDFIEDDTGKAFLQYTDESPTLTIRLITPLIGYCFDLLYFIANHDDDHQLKIYQWLFNCINDSNETTDNASGNMRLQFIYDALNDVKKYIH